MPPDGFRDDDGVVGRMAALGVPPGRPALPYTTRFRRMGTADLLSLPERGYLLKGVMAPGELSVWWGPPKCGKSFLMLHVAYALAQGRSVFGRRVKQCRVLYLACEGKSGLRARVEALVRRYGHADDLEIIAEPLNLRDGGDLDALIEIVRDGSFGLVIVDTLNRVMAAGDENSSIDMGAVRTNLDTLRAETGAHVAVIHHGTKSGTGGPRGHGSLLGAVDASIAVEADEEGNRTAKLQDMKDDPTGALAFRLDVVDLGTDGDGDPRTTCQIVEEGDAPAKRRKGKPLTETQAGWLRELQDMFAAPGKAELREPVEGMKGTLTLTRAEVRQGYRVRGRFTTEDPNLALTSADKVRLSSMLMTLKDKGKIGLTDKLVWLLP